MDVTNGLAYCQDIPTIVSDPARAKVVTRPLKDLDNGVGFSSQTWSNVQEYIQTLKTAAETKCK